MSGNIRMKREDAEKWLAALRSGTYEQGTGSMCVDGKYCCLGVLEHVLSGEVESHDYFTGEMPEDKKVRVLPLPSLQWLKYHEIRFLEVSVLLGDALYSDKPTLSTLEDKEVPGTPVNAAVANDQGYTFAQIADAIEVELEYIE